MTNEPYFGSLGSLVPRLRASDRIADELSISSFLPVARLNSAMNRAVLKECFGACGFGGGGFDDHAQPASTAVAPQIANSPMTRAIGREHSACPTARHPA